MNEESVINNYNLAAVCEDLVSGATLHHNDGAEGNLAVLVWPDGRAKSANIIVCDALDDMDFLDVVRSTKEGLELCINDDGRRWLAKWQAQLAARGEGAGSETE